ncbi:MAG TPA: iron-sulfur cluster repair di-iron protein [Vicinamibacterales bacterium]|jgi:regulator of cell morphogenesis and NO signaling
MSDSFKHATVGDVVAADFRAASIFQQFGIDFCCGGRRSVAEACRAAAVDPAVIERALKALPATDDPDRRHAERWSVDQLIDHILDRHHAYLYLMIPIIGRYLAKLVDVHGCRHPELAQTAVAFDHVCADLRQHMTKEERVLFPYVRALGARGDDVLSPSPFGTVENPIRMIEREHRQAADEMRQIRELTNNYTPPADGCTTYRVAFEELARFERDLHEHVHLENNVLFPKAIELERGVCRG